MLQKLCSRFKERFSRRDGSNALQYRIKELERQIEQLRSEINPAQVINIEKIIIEKIVCERFETNYTIDSLVTENLSGTMNIGTIYPGPALKGEPAGPKNSPRRPEPAEPKVTLTY